jgi:large subunit ribosomal protein L19
MDKIQQATKEFIKEDIPEFGSGDTLSVDVRVREGSKERIQKFEGVVISRHGGNGLDASFTLRKITNGVGVERIFPLHSPLIASFDLKRRGKVRRAKLNYLKNVKGAKAARIEEKR